MTILKGFPLYVLIRQYECGTILIDETTPMINDLGAVRATIDEGGKEDKYQVIELNIEEGYSRDITEDTFATLTNPKIGKYTFENGVIGWMSEEDKQYFEREFAMQKGN